MKQLKKKYDSNNSKFVLIKDKYLNLIFDYENLEKKNYCEDRGYKKLDQIIFDNDNIKKILKISDEEINKKRYFSSFFIQRWFIILMETGRFEFARNIIDKIFISEIFSLTPNKYKKNFYKKIHSIINEFEDYYDLCIL